MNVSVSVCISDLDSSRRLNKTKEEELKKKDGDLSSYKEQMKPVTAERDELKRERDELETKVSIGENFPRKSPIYSTNSTGLITLKRGRDELETKVPIAQILTHSTSPTIYSERDEPKRARRAWDHGIYWREFPAKEPYIFYESLQGERDEPEIKVATANILTLSASPPTYSERDELQREHDELETNVAIVKKSFFGKLCCEFPLYLETKVATMNCSQKSLLYFALYIFPQNLMRELENILVVPVNFPKETPYTSRNALYIPLYIPPYIPTYTFPNVWVWVWVCVCVCARVYVYLFGFVRIWVLLKSFQHLTSTHACAHVQMHTCSMAYRWTRCASHTRTRTHAWKDRERDTTWQVLVGYVFLLHVYIYTHTHTTCTCVYMYIYIHTHTLQDQCSLATCFPYA